MQHPVNPTTGSYRDRHHAGQVLGQHLAERPLHEPVVFGLARGGVPVACQVAEVLHAPVRVSVARKIGAPGQPELALGAVTADGPATYDQRLLRAFGTDAERMRAACEGERREARRREQLYQQGPAPNVAGRDVILVDDGLATGATARAAVRGLRGRDPRSVVLAVPVGAAEAVTALGQEADLVICPLQPATFRAVGQWYDDFRPTTDEDILALLS